MDGGTCGVYLFVAGTKISLENGDTNIEDIVVGDEVMADGENIGVG